MMMIYDDNILVDPLAGVETNSSLINWLTGLLVDWFAGCWFAGSPG
jgi:hypothetical protein